MFKFLVFVIVFDKYFVCLINFQKILFNSNVTNLMRSVKLSFFYIK